MAKQMKSRPQAGRGSSRGGLSRGSPSGVQKRRQIQRPPLQRPVVTASSSSRQSTSASSALLMRVTAEFDKSEQFAGVAGPKTLDVLMLAHDESL